MGKPKIIRPAAYTLIVEDGSLLLCRLCPPEPDTGKWTLPGGGLEFGESPEDGAIRETFEESGLHVKLEALIEVQSQLFDFPDREMHALRFVYTATVEGGSLRNEVEGSTDLCAFVPLNEVGGIQLVELGYRGVVLSRSILAQTPFK